MASRAKQLRREREARREAAAHGHIISTPWDDSMSEIPRIFDGHRTTLATSTPFLDTPVNGKAIEAMQEQFSDHPIVDRMMNALSRKEEVTYGMLIRYADKQRENPRTLLAHAIACAGRHHYGAVDRVLHHDERVKFLNDMHKQLNQLGYESWHPNAPLDTLSR